MIHFADPYPDELLFSAWSRSAAHLQYPNRYTYLTEIAGGKRHKASIDFPYHLDRFIASLPDSSCYTVEDLLYSHTLYPVYAPFLPPERASQLQAYMQGDEGGHPYWKMHLMESTMLRRGWFRVCMDCVAHDRAIYGESYWHRLHQIWGVLVCPIHHIELATCRIEKEEASVRILLTAEQALEQISLPTKLDPDGRCMAEQIACAFADLLAGRFPHIDLHARYHELLQDQGWLKPQGKVRLFPLLKAIEALFSPTLLTMLRCAFNPQQRSEKSWVYRLLGKSLWSQHPLYHVLMIIALQRSVTDFFAPVSPSPPSHPFGSGPWPCLNPVCEWYHKLVITTCRLSQISKKGRQTGTFACTCGFTYWRTVYGDHRDQNAFRKDRTVAYGSQWLQQFQMQWYSDQYSLEALARLLGVSEMALRSLAARLGFRSRGMSYTEELKETIRQQWLLACSQDGHLPRKQFWKKHDSLRYRLNRYDREWYDAHPLPSVAMGTYRHPAQQPPIVVQGPTDWEARDREMAQAIMEYVQTRDEAGETPKRRTQTQIIQAIPQLNWLHRLQPKYYLQSRALLLQLTEDQETFVIRKIRWLAEKCLIDGMCPSRHQFLVQSGAHRLLERKAILSSINEAFALLSATFPDRNLTLFSEDTENVE
jgi:Tn7-like transposition protein D/TniQ